ncbi:MAG: type III-A CRISPR-associated protein Cas10/Csm1 [Desulfobacterium sp.]|nr:type III-A CRISPR-associated protein Cas10/Csm1 [Desulfobacterium sp.]
MDNTVLKIAIAAFMHDMGKFAGRDCLEISKTYINNNADLYQPFFDGRHTHVHALYTANFIENEQTSEFLPLEFNKAGWGEGDSFVNLAAGHHRPSTPMQWIVAIADRIDSGWNRDSYENQYNQAVGWRDYEKTRLVPLFEQLMRKPIQKEGYHKELAYAYPLKELSPRSIFPVLKEEIEPITVQKAKEEYFELFKSFCTGLSSLMHLQENMELWFEHFDSLIMKYASCIPSARAGNIVPDISLYDHLRGTSALATAMYVYHRDKDTLNEKAIQNYDDPKFLIVNGDFFGIQDFIFKGYGDTRKFRSKLLRGRSLAVSLFSELAADMLCREMGLPFSSCTFNAAGKFTVLAPNTSNTFEIIKKVETTINDWLVNISYGENSLGLSYTQATPNDFVDGAFQDLQEKCRHAMELKKSSRVDLNRHGGVISDYADQFNTDLSHALCPICGKRPSSERVENCHEIGGAGSSCALCRDHIFLGTNIVKGNSVAICSPDIAINRQEDLLMEPIFGSYQVAFITGGLTSEARNGRLLRLWKLGMPKDGSLPRDASLRFISGYIPIVTKEDLIDDRYASGLKSEEKIEDLIDGLELGAPKTFGHIAARSKTPINGKGKFQGVEALGTLKVDVDKLGLLMACGLEPERLTQSRMATLSRQLHYFFTLHLPNILQEDGRFSDVYTVFAGGDDLFLIGPWNRILDLARVLHKDFAAYVAHNPKIHFSAGITLHRPNTPLDILGKAAETALEMSKDADGNSLTAFSETAPWNDIEKIDNAKKTLLQWLQDEWINNAFLYKFNEFIQMAAKEHEVVKGGELYIKDMDCTRWRAMLAYTAERNLAKTVKKEMRKTILETITSTTAAWLQEFGGGMRIALWEILYNLRRR